MDYLRQKAPGAGNILAEFTACGHDYLTDLYGAEELDRQFRVAAAEQKDIILRYFPEDIIDQLFDKRNAVREHIAFTPALQAEIAAFQEKYRQQLLAALAAEGIVPPSGASLTPDLTRLAETDLSDYMVLDAQRIGSGAFVRLDAAFGIIILRFEGVSLFETDGITPHSRTADAELWKVPDGFEYDLALDTGGLRVAFASFRFEFEFIDLAGFVLTYDELPYTPESSPFYDPSILFNAYAAACADKKRVAGVSAPFEELTLSLRKLLDCLLEEREVPPHRSGFYRYFSESAPDEAVRAAVDAYAPPAFRAAFDAAYTLASAALVYEEAAGIEAERQMERLGAREALAEGAEITEGFSRMIAERAVNGNSDRQTPVKH